MIEFSEWSSQASGVLVYIVAAIAFWLLFSIGFAIKKTEDFEFIHVVISAACATFWPFTASGLIIYAMCYGLYSGIELVINIKTGG